MASAIKTGGTSTTTVLKALQWQPSSETPSVGDTGWTTDLATLNAYVTGLATVSGNQSKTIFPIPRIVNGGMVCFSDGTVYKMDVGDWLYVDPVTGYCWKVPKSVVTGGSFVHS